MKKIVLATGNAHKAGELRQILGADAGLVVTMKELGLALDAEEDGRCFKDNALIKARCVYEKLAARKDDDTEYAVLADDSGLEIAALGGAPGIYSARFMGEHTPYQVKNAALLEQLRGVTGEARAADFACAMALILPGDREIVVQGRMDGVIAEQPAGENGFGYDPIFYLPEKGRTSAELSPEEKNWHAGRLIRGSAMRSGRSTPS